MNRSSHPATLVLHAAHSGLRPWEAFLTCLASATLSTLILLENTVETIRLCVENVPFKLLLLVAHLCLQLLLHPVGIRADSSLTHLSSLLPPLCAFAGVAGFSCIRARVTLAELIDWLAFARYAARQRHLYALRKRPPVTWIVARAPAVESVSVGADPSSLVLAAGSSGEQDAVPPKAQEVATGVPVRRVLLSLFGQFALQVEGPDGQQVALPITNRARQALLAYIATEGRTTGVERSTIYAHVCHRRSKDKQGWFNKNIARLRDDINAAAQRSGFAHVELFFNRRDQSESFWSLSEICEVVDLCTFERLVRLLNKELRQEESDAGKIRAAYLQLMQIYAHGYLVNQLHDEYLQGWAQATFTKYNNQYLYALRLAARVEQTWAQRVQGNEQLTGYTYAAHLYEHYAFAASQTPDDRKERRGEPALRDGMRLYGLAKEPHLAGEIYHSYINWMKKDRPKWTPQPETTALWKHLMA